MCNCGDCFCFSVSVLTVSFQVEGGYAAITSVVAKGLVEVAFLDSSLAFNLSTVPGTMECILHQLDEAARSLSKQVQSKLQWSAFKDDLVENIIGQRKRIASLRS